MERGLASRRIRRPDRSGRGVLHGLRRHCQRVRGDGAVEPPVSGSVVFVAEAAARHRFPCLSERRVRVFSRKSRPGGQHRPGHPTASGLTSRAMAGDGFAASPRTAGPDALSRTGVRDDGAVHLLRRPSRRPGRGRPQGPPRVPVAVPAPDGCRDARGRAGSEEARLLHTDLLTLRRSDVVLSGLGTPATQVATSALTGEILLLRYSTSDDERLMLVNLGPRTTLRMNDPLLAPASKHVQWT